MVSRTNVASALVRNFPVDAALLLARRLPLKELEEALEASCDMQRVNYLQLLSGETGALRRPSIELQRTHNDATISPPNSNASSDSYSSRLPTRATFSRRTPNPRPRPEYITALIVRDGGQPDEHPLTMKHSSTNYSFISQDIVDDLGLLMMECDPPVTMPYIGAPEHILRVDFHCLLTWIRNTAERTRRTKCLIVGHLDTDIQLGDRDYYSDGTRGNIIPDRAPSENYDAGIAAPNPKKNLYPLSYHPSANTTSDSETVKPSAANNTYSQGQGQGPGQAYNLVDGLMRGIARRGSSSPSHIPRPSAPASPSKTTESPTSNQSQARTQPTAGPSTPSKLSQSTRLSTALEVEYIWGEDSEAAASGTLDLTASGEAFLKSLQDTCQCSLEMDLNRETHFVRFISDIEIEKPRKRILNLHDDTKIHMEWERTVDWINKNKASKSPQLWVIIVERRGK